MCLCCLKFLQMIYLNETWVIDMLILVAAPSKPWVCGHSLAGISGSNPAEIMDVLSLECILETFDGPIARPEDTYRVWRV